jgi:cytochrome c-type biogenesis protein CcmH/NrfG
MRRPALRLAYAIALLALYYQTLLGTTTAVAAPPVTADEATLADIDASQVAFSAGRYAEALPPTQRLTQNLPGQAMYADRLARILHELGRAREEAKAWEEVFRTSPTPVDACPMLGDAYARIPDPAGALSAYERCVQVEPQDPDLLLFLGRAYNAAERGAEARRVLEQTLALAPDYADAYLLLGIRNFVDGDLKAARASFEKFLALAPARQQEVAVWLERTREVSR